MRIICPSCQMPTESLNNNCEYCGYDIDKELKSILITTDSISKLRKEDLFISSLSLREFSFIIETQ